MAFFSFHEYKESRIYVPLELSRTDVCTLLISFLFSFSPPICLPLSLSLCLSLFPNFTLSLPLSYQPPRAAEMVSRLVGDKKQSPVEHHRINVRKIIFIVSINIIAFWEWRVSKNLTFAYDFWHLQLYILLMCHLDRETLDTTNQRQANTRDDKHD